MSENLSFYALIISLASAVFTGLGFRLSVKKSKMEKLTHESQFMGGILHEISLSEEKLTQIKTPDDCLNFARGYLNILDKLCYFDVKGYLTDEIMDFFKNYMKYGLGYYQWLIDIDLDKSVLEEGYSNVVKSCKKHNIIPPTFLGQPFEEHRERIKKKKATNPS